MCHGADQKPTDFELASAPAFDSAERSARWHSQDGDDHPVIWAARHPTPPLTYEHLSGAGEPLLWLADASATGLVASCIVMRLLVLRLVLGAGLRRALASVLSCLSLTFVIQTASLRGLLGLPATWERTNKFQARSHRRSALASARSEIVAGVTARGAATIGLLALPHGGVAMMLLLGVAAVGAVYLTSPIVALIADRDLERHTDINLVPPPPAPLSRLTRPAPRRRHTQGPSTKSDPSGLVRRLKFAADRRSGPVDVRQGRHGPPPWSRSSAVNVVGSGANQRSWWP